METLHTANNTQNSLTISNLHVETADGKEILKGVSLTITKGEIHAVMGPNGSGKTTLSQALMGHPGYVITKGSIILNGEEITNLPPNQKAKRGLFLSFQYPVEVSGVAFGNFLRLALNEKNESGISNMESGGKKISPIAFRKILLEKAKALSFSEDFASRSLNEGFSGGEKKKAEILQLSILRPQFAILDEPDSGLDVDALKHIAKAIQALDYNPGLLLITHYQRILQYIKPHFVHVFINGTIATSGGIEVVEKIENAGYEQFA